MPQTPPSCYVLYIPSTSTPNFGVSSLPKLKILYETLHTHTQAYPYSPGGVYETLSHL